MEREVRPLEGVPPQGEGHGVLLVNVGGAVAHDHAGPLEPVEVEDRLVEVGFQLALLAAFELDPEVDAVFGKPGDAEPLAFDRVTALGRRGRDHGRGKD